MSGKKHDKRNKKIVHVETGVPANGNGSHASANRSGNNRHAFVDGSALAGEHKHKPASLLTSAFTRRSLLWVPTEYDSGSSNSTGNCDNCEKLGGQNEKLQEEVGLLDSITDGLQRKLNDTVAKYDTRIGRSRTRFWSWRFNPIRATGAAVVLGAMSLWAYCKWYAGGLSVDQIVTAANSHVQTEARSAGREDYLRFKELYLTNRPLLRTSEPDTMVYGINASAAAQEYAAGFLGQLNSDLENPDERRKLRDASIQVIVDKLRAATAESISGKPTFVDEVVDGCFADDGFHSVAQAYLIYKLTREATGTNQNPRIQAMINEALPKVLESVLGDPSFVSKLESYVTAELKNNPKRREQLIKALSDLVPKLIPALSENKESTEYLIQVAQCGLNDLLSASNGTLSPKEGSVQALLAKEWPKYQQAGLEVLRRSIKEHKDKIVWSDPYKLCYVYSDGENLHLYLTASSLEDNLNEVLRAAQDYELDVSNSGIKIRPTDSGLAFAYDGKVKVRYNMMQEVFGKMLPIFGIMREVPGLNIVPATFAASGFGQIFAGSKDLSIDEVLRGADKAQQPIAWQEAVRKAQFYNQEAMVMFATNAVQPRNEWDTRYAALCEYSSRLYENAGVSIVAAQTRGDGAACEGWANYIGECRAAVMAGRHEEIKPMFDIAPELDAKTATPAAKQSQTDELLAKERYGRSLEKYLSARDKLRKR